MKNFLTSILVASSFLTFAQVQIDKPIDLNGAGVNAKITGIKSVTNAQDAVSAEVLQSGSLIYALSAGTSSAYTLSLAPTLGGYTTGMEIRFKAHIANAAGAVTINVNGLGAKDIKKDVSNNLATGDIQIDQLVSLAYDGTNFQLISRTTDANSGGTVTNVTGTAPISVINNSTTPAISISQANTSTNGFLSSTDWNTFNSKESALTFSNGLTRTSNAITLGGALTGATTITQAANALTLANNGASNTTINLSSTGDFDVQDNGVSALFVRDDANVGIGTTAPATRLHINAGVLGISRQDNADATPYMQLGLNDSWEQYITNNAFYNSTTDVWNYVATGGYGGRASKIGQINGSISFATATGGVNPIAWIERMSIADNGNVTVNNLAGTGIRPVYANASNVLTTTGGPDAGSNYAPACPTGWTTVDGTFFRLCIRLIDRGSRANWLTANNEARANFGAKLATVQQMYLFCQAGNTISITGAAGNDANNRRAWLGDSEHENDPYIITSSNCAGNIASSNSARANTDDNAARYYYMAIEYTK